MTKKPTNKLLVKKSDSLTDRKKPAKTLSQAVKNRRSEIKAAARKLIDETFINEKFKHSIRITNNGIKEWTKKNLESWIIVRKYDRVEDYVIHSISDNRSILQHLEKEEKDVD
jgi:hypothetical protein